MILQRLKRLFLKPISGIPLTISLVFFSSILSASLFDLTFLNYFLSLLGCLVFLETAFNFYHRLVRGHAYKIPKKIPFEKIHVEPHPYIPYIYKKYADSPPSELTRYPLHRGKYFTSKLRTNNLKFFNGENGDRDIIVPKPKNLFRIACLGASTTQNYITHNNKNYSYPLELEKILKSKLDQNLEVNNCGQGGYTTADILVRFMLQVCDTDPDAIIIYEAHADVRSYLIPNFESDYSHSRKNLGEAYWKLKLGSKIPNTPLNFINYFFSHWAPYNTRLSLIELVQKGQLKEDADIRKGLISYKRNLQHLIDSCKSKKIDVILSTYCHFLYDEIKNDSMHILYNQIIEKENEIMKELAIQNGLKIIDNAKLIPKEKKYFVDTVHFSHLGMMELAKNLSKAF